MSLVTAVDPGLRVRLSALLAHAASWKSVILLLGVLVIGLVSRLLAEWQRRKTLVAIVKEARGGSVIEQGRGRGGPAMRIEIGTIANDQGPAGRWPMTRRIPPEVAAQVARLFVEEAEAVFRPALRAARGDRPKAEDLVQMAFQAAAEEWTTIVGYRPCTASKCCDLV